MIPTPREPDPQPMIHRSLPDPRAQEAGPALFWSHQVVRVARDTTAG